MKKNLILGLVVFSALLSFATVIGVQTAVWTCECFADEAKKNKKKTLQLDDSAKCSRACKASPNSSDYYKVTKTATIAGLKKQESKKRNDFIDLWLKDIEKAGANSPTRNLKFALGKLKLDTGLDAALSSLITELKFMSIDYKNHLIAAPKAATKKEKDDLAVEKKAIDQSVVKYKDLKKMLPEVSLKPSDTNNLTVVEDNLKYKRPDWK